MSQGMGAKRETADTRRLRELSQSLAEFEPGQNLEDIGEHIGFLLIGGEDSQLGAVGSRISRFNRNLGNLPGKPYAGVESLLKGILGAIEIKRATIHASSISKYDRGQRDIMLEELAFAADELGVSTDELPKDVLDDIRRRYFISIGVPIEVEEGELDR
jgi:hypothetical protein